MKKLTYIISGFVALVFGFNFVMHNKTDFQKTIEKKIKIDFEKSVLASICGDGPCTTKKISG